MASYSKDTLQELLDDATAFGRSNALYHQIRELEKVVAAHDDGHTKMREFHEILSALMSCHLCMISDEVSVLRSRITSRCHIFPANRNLYTIHMALTLMSTA
jgi:hypothetical protein